MCAHVGSWPCECACILITLYLNLSATEVSDLSFIQVDSKTVFNIGCGFPAPCLSINFLPCCARWCVYSVQCSRWQYALGLQTSNKHEPRSHGHRQLGNICCCSALAVAMLFSLKIPTTSIASALLHQQSTRSPEDIIAIQQPTSSFGHGMPPLDLCTGKHELHLRPPL